jgi:hypothetical protein
MATTMTQTCTIQWQPSLELGSRPSFEPGHVLQRLSCVRSTRALSEFADRIWYGNERVLKSSGLIVPMISTPEQASTIVNLSRFPPQGIRGQGGPFACVEYGLSTPREYVERANAELVVIMQVETKEGVDNIQAICETDGVGAYSHSIAENSSWQHADRQIWS